MKGYTFKIGGKQYNVTVSPKEGKVYDVTVNGATYEVEAENAPASIPAPQAAPAPVAAAPAPEAPKEEVHFDKEDLAPREEAPKAEAPAEEQPRKAKKSRKSLFDSSLKRYFDKIFTDNGIDD